MGTAAAAAAAMVLAAVVGNPFGPQLGPHFTETPQREYDFVVVGGGTAGSLIAAQLARSNPKWEVLLLEAGGATRDGAATEQTIPGRAVDNVALENIDWRYRIEPQQTPLSGTTPSMYSERRYPIPRGKVLGGSNELNFMLHVRGTPEDYDGWAAVTGDPRWGHTTMGALEDEYEALLGGVAGSKAAPADGTAPHTHPLADAWFEAAEQAGLKTTQSYNDFSVANEGPNKDKPRRREGGFHYQHGVRSGKRLSTARQVLLPLLRHRRNGVDGGDNSTVHSLSVVLHAHVSKLLWAPPSLVLGEHENWVKPRKAKGVRVQLVS